MVTELAKADFRKRFVGSYFGIVWMFIQPMVTIAIYAFIFGEHGMKNAPPVPGATYVIWLTPGIIPWFYFSEILNTGTNCLQSTIIWLKGSITRWRCFPVIKLISCLHGTYLLPDHYGGELYLTDGRTPRLQPIRDVILFLCGVDGLDWRCHLFYQRRCRRSAQESWRRSIGICLQIRHVANRPIMYDGAQSSLSRASWLEGYVKLNPFLLPSPCRLPRQSVLTGKLVSCRAQRAMTICFCGG
ncbi:MAG: ABC transporter permease [Clostridium fessum]